MEGVRLRRSRGFELGPLDLALAAGSSTAIVGPSGCGKTTLLRCIAGLERVPAGTIRIGDAVVDGGGQHAPPHARRIGFVFQDGALWPHLDAAAHLRFVDPSLSREEARARLDEVGLGALAARRPGELSGGEAQRLALARALAGAPRILLLDEPLRSVDVHLRRELTLLIRRAVERHGLTLVVVTHDRDEALALGEHIVVMRAGRIVEAARAEELLTAPRTAFGAEFMGDAQCVPVRSDAQGRIATPFGTYAHPQHTPEADVVLALLPGDVRLDAPGHGEPGRVLYAVPDHGRTHAFVEVGALVVRVACERAPAPGTSVGVRLVTTRFLPGDGAEEGAR
jgi:iron(III) transport system ATP-binding protein